MRRVASYGLLALWILWLLPFLLRRVRSTGIRPSKTAPVSILGMVLQAASFPIVFITEHLRAHPPNAWHIALSFAFGFVSLFLIWSAIPALGKQWRLQAGVYADHVLVQSGPYRFVRHPIYASMLALLLAAGLLVAPWIAIGIALLLMIAGTEIRVRAEDRLLAERFGQEFANYKARVPAYIPFLR
jgi:protein-S-isoprenylcysteine O-methyltransferase Ste14